MAITVSEIKKRIKILTDEYASAYLSNSQYTTLWSKASVSFFNKLLSKWQITRKVTEDLQSLSTSGTASVSSFIVDTSGLSDYWKFQNIKPTYTVGNKTYSEYGRELKAIEKGSSFSSGSYLYPRYVLNNTGIELFPQTGNCTSALVEYFRTPFETDFDDDNDTSPYDIDVIDQIILEFANQLALLEREDLFYTQIDREINENPL